MADTDPAALGRVANGYGVERLHVTADALVEDPEVECVGVLVPARSHPEVAEAALAAGKHVLIEKPLAPSVEECDQMVEAAARMGVVAMVGHNLRFHRLVRRARTLIEAGAIGEPETVRTMIVSVHGESSPVDGRWIDGAARGSVMMEVGVHQYDLWRLLSGAEAIRVLAVATVEGSYDRRAAVSAILTGDIVAEATMVRGRPATNEVMVIGSDGRLDLDLYAFDGLRVRGPEEISGSPRTRLARATAVAGSLPHAVVDLARGGAYVRSYANEWRHFLACIRGEAGLQSGLAEGREAVRVALAAARSTQERAAIELAGVDPVRIAPAGEGHPG